MQGAGRVKITSERLLLGLFSNSVPIKKDKIVEIIFVNCQKYPFNFTRKDLYRRCFHVNIA